MKVKVCGLKYKNNIKDIVALKPDFIGFIFYESSPRFVGSLLPDELNFIPLNVKRVGVFVNDTIENIEFQTRRFKLNYIQLHGDEEPDFCLFLKNKGFNVIKAIGIESDKDIEKANLYQDCCDYLLFDTKSVFRGGTGRAFDWNIISKYKGKLDFLLSGGICNGDCERIIKLDHPKLMGVDLNSKFEFEYGLKNETLLNDFMMRLKCK